MAYVCYTTIKQFVLLVINFSFVLVLDYTGLHASYNFFYDALCYRQDYWWFFISKASHQKANMECV